MDTNIDALFKAVRQCSAPTHQAVDDFQRSAAMYQQHMVEQFKASGSPFLRIFKRMALFVDYYKILKIKQKIITLRSQAADTEEKSKVDALIWRCQKKGFVSHHDVESAKEAMAAHTWLCDALQVSGAYDICIVSKEKGALQLVSVAKGSCTVLDIMLKKPLGVYSIQGKRFATIEALLATYCPAMVPLSQLQEVALWLQAHGSARAVPLTSQLVEEKLSKLMRDCPTGAYLLYPRKGGGLALSRLLKHGQISHFSITLTANPGGYTFDIAGSPYYASRAEFKRKLEMMGTPLRIQVAT
jgi:hypothetical protein